MGTAAGGFQSNLGSFELPQESTLSVNAKSRMSQLNYCGFNEDGLLFFVTLL